MSSILSPSLELIGPRSGEPLHRVRLARFARSVSRSLDELPGHGAHLRHPRWSSGSGLPWACPTTHSFRGRSWRTSTPSVFPSQRPRPHQLTATVQGSPFLALLCLARVPVPWHKGAAERQLMSMCFRKRLSISQDSELPAVPTSTGQSVEEPLSSRIQRSTEGSFPARLSSTIGLQLRFFVFFARSYLIK